MYLLPFWPPSFVVQLPSCPFAVCALCCVEDFASGFDDDGVGRVGLLVRLAIS